MRTDQKAVADLKMTIRAIRDVGGGQAQIDAATGRNVLHEDLGQFGDDGLTRYHLDEETRDRLLAHARQDAAHAVISIATANKRVERLTAMVGFLAVATVVLAVLILLR